MLMDTNVLCRPERVAAQADRCSGARTKRSTGALEHWSTRAHAIIPVTLWRPTPSRAPVTSIRHRLLIWLLAGMTASIALGSWAVYARARAQVREIFDFQLQQMASALPAEVFSRQRSPHDQVDLTDVVVRIWDEKGRQLYVSHKDTLAPLADIAGFASIGTAQGNWRVYSTTVGNNVVQVAQSTSVREQLAKDMAIRAMAPLAILLPALISLVLITVSRGLKPLDDIAQAMQTQSPQALQPIPEHPVPKEVRLLVRSLNQLLARLDQAMRLQRAFIADAAHELRTPLTAVMVQLKLARRANTSKACGEALDSLQGGAERATHLVKQLLSLARAEPEALSPDLKPIDLDEIAREVVGEQATIAEAMGVDLGLEGEPALQVRGHAESLRVLLGNLVDNAIRYTPRSGSVDVVLAREHHVH